MMRMIVSSSKKNIISFSLVIAVVSFLFYAYEDGITGRTLKSSEPGCSCHSEVNSSQVNVVIEGPDQLITGETAEYSVRISGGPLTRGGTNVAVTAGNLQPGAGMQKVGQEITHTSPKEPAGDEVVFSFMYTAPNNPATVTMYANGNSVNFSGTEFGDQWNFAENKTIIIDAVAGTENDISETNFYLEQNYPNPFNPSTKIIYSIENYGFVSLKVYDVLGNEISTLVNEERNRGIYEAEFSISNNEVSNLSSGIYYYVLKTGQKSLSRKMLLLK
ncbi:MAG: T9SS C-terminal target domain-containing protein [Ignavibacteriales bacterium]|nr:MAG: T9SS C-terminal target domain-containing protein [Ignavibacteriales bacterium]